MSIDVKPHNQKIRQIPTPQAKSPLCHERSDAAPFVLRLPSFVPRPPLVKLAREPSKAGRGRKRRNSPSGGAFRKAGSAAVRGISEPTALLGRGTSAPSNSERSREFSQGGFTPPVAIKSPLGLRRQSRRGPQKRTRFQRVLFCVTPQHYGHIPCLRLVREPSEAGRGRKRRNSPSGAVFVERRKRSGKGNF